MKYWLLCAGVAALVPVLDQLTKYFVRTFLQVGESVSVWGDFFRIHYILNDGMAFGSFGGARWVFMIFTPIALAAIVYYLVRYRKNLSALSAVSLSMVFGGGCLTEELWISWILTSAWAITVCGMPSSMLRMPLWWSECFSSSWISF